MVAKESIKKCNDSSKWDPKWLPINPPRKFHVNTTMHCVPKCDAGTGSVIIMGCGVSNSEVAK